MNSLARTLGAEEPDVTTVAIRPGVVDTGVRPAYSASIQHQDALVKTHADLPVRPVARKQMQALIRSTGGTHMSASDHSKFTALHSSGELLNPDEYVSTHSQPRLGIVQGSL
jgi:hypothetical protein